ncbi:MAG: PAS domain S-box protein [Acidobacteriia bacterium]|nr:PAS domain S-box protein [Terriglobia bacterium]
MIWAIAGLVYAAGYAALVAVLGDAHLRLLVGNAALLLPPLVPLAVVVWRRRRWGGQEAVYWGAIGTWALLWFIGQIGWSADEVLHATPLPWFKWHIVLQLCGSALPLIALVARPHRRDQPGTAVTSALDITVLVVLAGFLYWSLIIAPGREPTQASMALRSLAIIGPLVRLAAVAGLLWASWAARNGPWAAVYLRMAAGMILAFIVLTVLSLLTVRGAYQTGSPADVGWMLPFFFAAWAAESAPASSAERRAVSVAPVRHSSPALLFAAILTVPFLGYGLVYLMPLDEAVDRMRTVATAATLVGGIALILVRLRVEQWAVEQANERIRLLATACEQAGELIAIVSGDRIEYANDAFCRAVGYSREELEHVTPMRLVAAESEADIPPLRERLREKQGVRSTTVMRRHDGSTFQADWTASPILDGAGRVTHVVGVVRDLTDDLRLQEQIVRSERLSAIGELVSGVAHELNNPLQSILGTAQTMLGEARDPALQADLERVRLEADRAGRIVRNLLAFVRKSSSERVLLDINEVVQSAVRLRAYGVEIAGIEVREEYAPNLALVLANRDDLQQVVINLIMNAQEAMAAAGVHGVLAIRTAMEKDTVIVEVRDEGPGIPPEVAGRIFEPFFTTRPAGSGPGLGLSVAFGIATAHHGTLELIPTDRGACFRLTLPGGGFPGPRAVH